MLESLGAYATAPSQNIGGRAAVWPLIDAQEERWSNGDARG